MRSRAETMQNRSINFLNYIILALACYILAAAGLLLIHPIQDFNILMCQVISIISSIVFVAIGLKVTYRSIFPLIFIFQIIFSYALFFDFKYVVGDILGYNAIDSLLYSELAQKTAHLSLEQFVAVLGDHLRSISDYGFPFFMRFVYKLTGDAETGHIILISLNCCLQTVTCYLMGRLAYIIKINISSIKLIVLLWGINPCSIYLNASGLKEPLFCFICMAIMYGIYRCHDSHSKIHHVILLLLIGISWFFRNYMTLFFLFIYFGYCIFPNLYKKTFWIICCGSFLLCIGFTYILVDYFPEIYYAMLHSEEILPSGAGKYVYYVLAFLAPIPKFFNISTPQMLLSVGYSMLKFSCSVFAIVGSYYWIKAKAIRFFPLINIFIFTIIMLIVSAHYIDYRYAYPIMPCCFIMMFEGFKYCKKWITYCYLLGSVFIVVLFNLQLY